MVQRANGIRVGKTNDYTCAWVALLSLSMRSDVWRGGVRMKEVMIRDAGGDGKRQ